MVKRKMKIGELARESGLSIHTLRFYEKAGIIDSGLVSRTENNYRDYDDAVLESLNIVKYARNAGFTLREIAALMREEKIKSLAPEEKKNLLEEKLAEIDRRLEEIKAVREVVAGKLERIGKESWTAAVPEMEEKEQL